MGHEKIFNNIKFYQNTSFFRPEEIMKWTKPH